MKLLTLGLLFTGTLFASENFKENVDYLCINTHSIVKGEKFDVKTKDAQNNPLIITVKENKIYTSDKTVFNYLMKREDMSSYSNEDFMLLLTKDLELGLVPKKSRGQLQYYFKCSVK